MVLFCQAVVSRGGRPDLVGKRLIDVETPTLLLVGGHPSEHDVVIMNQNAFKQMSSCTNKEIKVPLLEIKTLSSKPYV